MAAASLALAFHSIQSCTTATTCSVTLAGSITTGDLIEIETATSSATIISSVSGCGGTFVDGNFRSGNSSDRFMTGGYVYPATGTAGPCVITYSGSSGGAKVEVFDYTVAGGTPALDATCDVTSASGLSSPYSGCSATLTSTAPVVAEATSSNANVTAVAAPFSSAADFSTGFGAASASGLASGFTAPSWTSSGVSIAERVGMIFGFNPTACSFEAMTDFSGGSNGAAPTAATLQTSTFGATGQSSPVGATQAGAWTVTDGSSALTYATAAHQSFLGTAPRFCSGGTTYSDDTLGFNRSTLGSIATATFTFPYSTSGVAVSPVVLASATFQTSHAQTDTVNCDCFGIFGSGSGGTQFALLLEQGNGTVLVFSLEGATAGSNVPLASNTLYHVAIEYAQSGIIKSAIYDSTGLQVGNTQTGVADNGPAVSLIVGDNLSSSETSGHNDQWNHIQYCYVGCTDAQFPLGIPVKVSTPIDAPGAGTYSNTAAVTLSAVNSSSILYTTDGSTPSCPSTGTTYSGSFNVTVTTTVKAIGCSSNSTWVSSAVLTSVYTITSDITTGNPNACVTPGTAPCTSVIGSGVTGTTLTFAVTIPTNSGNHPALLLGIVSGKAVSTCTYNGTSMTRLQTSKADGAGTADVTQFLLINPATGSAHNVVCTQGSSSFMQVFAQPYFGVNQTGTVGNSWRTPPASTNDGGSGTATSTITVTSVAGDLVVDATNVFSNPITVGTGIAQVQLYNVTGVNGSQSMGISKFKATGTSTVMTWTMTSSFWSHCGVSLIPG